MLVLAEAELVVQQISLSHQELHRPWIDQVGEQHWHGVLRAGSLYQPSRRTDVTCFTFLTGVSTASMSSLAGVSAREPALRRSGRFGGAGSVLGGYDNSSG